MKLTSESKLFLAIAAISVVIIAVASMALTKPAPTFTNADLLPKDSNAKGNPNAKVTLVEFSDFQCPACLAAKPIVEAVFEKNKENMIFAYRHFPLDQHPFARKAAQAAEAAAKQGKFWEMYELLFANQAKLSDSIFLELAKELSLDVKKFEEDMNSSALKNRVSKDQADGTRFGVNSTPSFYLNGKKLDLASFDDIAKAVDEAIKNNQ